MKAFLQAAAASLLLVVSASAQSAPSQPAAPVDGADRAAISAAGNERLLGQRAGSAALAASVSAADSETLTLNASRHAEFTDMRGDDISHHDIHMIVIIAVVVVVLIIVL